MLISVQLAKDVHMPAKGFMWLSTWVRRVPPMQFGIPFCLTLFQVLHRIHERQFVKIVFAAVKAASFRMGIAQPPAIFDAYDGNATAENMR